MTYIHVPDIDMACVICHLQNKTLNKKYPISEKMWDRQQILGLTRANQQKLIIKEK